MQRRQACSPREMGTFNPHERGECNLRNVCRKNINRLSTPTSVGNATHRPDSLFPSDNFQPPRAWGMQLDLGCRSFKRRRLSTPTSVGNATLIGINRWAYVPLSTPTSVGNATQAVLVHWQLRSAFNPHERGECNSVHGAPRN